MNETALPGLVRDAAAGDQKALTQLYNFTYNDVYNTAKFLVKDEDAALDIMQDTYIKPSPVWTSCRIRQSSVRGSNGSRGIWCLISCGRKRRSCFLP